MTDRPNVVWIVLDSIRADRTGLGSHDRDTTPNLDAIASKADGRGYADCITHGVWSLPSTASLLTGTPPGYHGVGLSNETLPEAVETVPERVADAGYETLGLSMNPWFNASTGLDRGFDQFSWLNKPGLLRAAPRRAVLKFLRHVRSHSAGFSLDPNKHCFEYLFNETVKAQLRNATDESSPVFCYAHYQAAHHPYYPPKGFQDRFASTLDTTPGNAARIAYERTADVHEAIAAGCPFSETEWNAIRGMYDSMVAYADHLVGDLFEFVRERLPGETIFVVTADHGEHLGESNLLSHMVTLDDALVRVPMVVHGFDDLPERLDLVQHSDVMRSILEAIGVETAGMQAIDPRTERRETAFAQRGAKSFSDHREAVREHDPSFEFATYDESLLQCARTASHKFLEWGSGSELRAIDGTERAVSDPDVRADLSDRLAAWTADVGEPVSSTGTASRSSDVRQQLSDLGYVD